MTKTPILSAALAATLLAAGPGALAQSMPPEGVVEVDLVPGWRTEDGTHMAGLRIRLAPGWKTYWRAPGDAGIPPDFAWREARNVAGVRLHWPVPEISHQNDMRSIVYSDQIVIPMEFTTPDSGAARVSGVVELGVCADICIPVSLPISAVLPPEGGRDPAIVAALIDQPESAAEAGVRAARCDVTPIDGGLRISARLELPAAGGAEAVVIEAGDPALWVSEPRAWREGGTLHAMADVLPMGGGAVALDRSDLRITVLGQDRAVDIRGCD